MAQGISGGGPLWQVFNLRRSASADPEKNREYFTHVRLDLEKMLQNEFQDYNWFTLYYTDDGPRVKFGAKSRNPGPVIKVIEKLKGTFSDLIEAPGEEKVENCRLMAIGSQCRRKLEDAASGLRVDDWVANSFVVHYMLNPCLYHDEALIHTEILSALGNQNHIKGDEKLIRAIRAMQKELSI